MITERYERGLVKTPLGFPPRPVPGSTIDLRHNEIATPKINGSRTLWNLQTGEVFNRKMRPFAQNGGIDFDVKHEILKELRHQINSDTVEWVDIEYVPLTLKCANGRRLGSDPQAFIIDVLPDPGNHANADYHERIEFYKNVPIVNDRSSLVDVSREVLSNGLQDNNVWRFPIYTEEDDAERAFLLHKKNWEMLDARDIGNQYLWEGIVAVDITLPYRLTPKQTMNMDMHTKYRFR